MEEAPQRVPVVPTGRMSNTSGRPLSTTDDTSTTTTTTTTTTTSTTSTITALTSTAAAAAAASPRSTPPQPYPRPPSSTGSYPSPIPSPVPDRRPVRGHEGGFVYPASFLRPRGLSHPMPPAQPERAIDREERQALVSCFALLFPSSPRCLLFPLKSIFLFAPLMSNAPYPSLRAIRNFLKVRTSYDVLPLSFRLIMFDTSLSVKESLNILIQNGIVSAPLWDSTSSTFAGLLTTSDYINVIQYYYQNPEALNQIDQFRLDSLREVEKALHVAPPETISIDPERPLYEACRRMLESRARRIPLVTFDSQTDRALVLSVLTQYRILKFVAVNVNDTQKLRKPLGEILLGSYHNIAVASMDTPVIDVIHILVSRSISSVPIINTEGVVYNVFEAVDVITLIKGGVYDDLSLTVGEALKKRSPDFPGIYTCSLNDGLDTIFDTIRKSRVHRLVVVDDNFRLKGVLTLSDILQYILLEATHIYNLHGKAFLRASDVAAPQRPAQDLISADKGSRLIGLKTLFRSRKSQHLRLDSGSSGLSGKPIIVVEEGYNEDHTATGHLENQQSVGLQVTQSSDLLKGDADRKVSDKTVYSLSSDLTSVTVCHDPSKRTSMPIALVDQDCLHHNPYSDIQEASHSTAQSSVNLEDLKGATSYSSRQHSSERSGASGLSTCPIRTTEKPENPFTHTRSYRSRGSSRQSSDFAASLDDSYALAQGDRHAAIIAFNELASRLRLEPLEVDETLSTHGGAEWGQVPAERSPDSRQSHTATGDDHPRRRDKFYGRIRTMRSTLQLGSSDAPRKRTLRRMRTFASLSRRSADMTSLKGKPLEDLARLGGYNLLSLPADFAPTKLRLPVCFVAIITYLGCFAPTVRNVFVDAGDPKLAARTYDYYANQVHSAEKQQDKIQMTVASGTMPANVVDPLNRDGDSGDAIRVLSVAWAFKALLSGLPGGILGSGRLYRVLVQICQGHLTCEPMERRRSCLGGLSPRGYVKVKAMSLAILALSDSMQLNLICGVFGLSALLLHETQRLIELERQGFRGSVCRASIGSGLLNLDRLSGVLAPLLTEREGEETHEDTFRAIQREIEGQRVAAMLIGSWRGVSRQLRIWEHRGAIAHHHGFSRTFSGSAEV
ncbi:hypothetical protein CBS147323_3483 [Aspergillus niger]|nr:hypothetical protein CBS147323_3483 [Aspergillus niger]KAI3032059.1 hypothetical protein CBS147347_1720 [Aspergillus niger]KAI3087263.1 hypothetical protein CBS147353_1015 [Aspergillus niger]